MKSLTVFCLVACCVMLAGCPYESDVPIDRAAVKTDPALLGTWQDVKNRDEIYNVSRKDEFTYDIETKEKEQKESEAYYAFVSLVNGTMFLNLWENKAGMESHTYALYKLEIKPDGTLTLSELTENITEKFSSSDELKKFVAANMSNSYFYGKEKINLVRMEK